jgi:phosphoglycolate phosphatase-like HAD superfamily hydrolase
MEKIGVLINMSGPLIDNRDYFVGAVNETLKNFNHKERSESDILSMYEMDPERFGKNIGIDSKYTIEHFKYVLEDSARRNSYSMKQTDEGSKLLKELDVPRYADLGIVLFGRETQEIVNRYKKQELIPTKYPILTSSVMGDSSPSEYLEKAREMAGSDCANTVVVTDSVQKLKLAKKLGMVPIGIDWGWHNIHHKELFSDNIDVAADHAQIVKEIDFVRNRHKKSI